MTDLFRKEYNKSLTNVFNTSKLVFVLIGHKFVNYSKTKFQLLDKIVSSAWHDQWHLKAGYSQWPPVQPGMGGPVSPEKDVLT